MAIIFDGKSFAKEKEVKLIEEIKRLSEKGIKPKLVSILIGDNPSSILYINLKKKAAERIGCALEVVYFPQDTSMIRIIEVINEMNTNQSVHGIMVQLPLPRNFSKEDRDEIINAIAKEKDVDGLREDSSFLTPTVKAVLEVIKEATLYLPFQPEAHANGLSSSGRGRPLDDGRNEGAKSTTSVKSSDSNKKLQTQKAQNRTEGTEKDFSVASETSAPSVIVNGKIEEVWGRVLTEIRPINASTEALLRAAKPVEFDGKTLTLGVYYRFHKERLESNPHREILGNVVEELFGNPIRVVCILTEPPIRPKDGQPADKKIEESVSNSDTVLTEGEDKDIIKVAKEIFGS